MVATESRFERKHISTVGRLKFAVISLFVETKYSQIAPRMPTLSTSAGNSLIHAVANSFGKAVAPGQAGIMACRTRYEPGAREARIEKQRSPEELSGVRVLVR